MAKAPDIRKTSLSREARAQLGYSLPRTRAQDVAERAASFACQSTQVQGQCYAQEDRSTRRSQIHASSRNIPPG